MTRDDIQSLLPFMANGTLSGDERAGVERALSNDAELRAELEVLRAIRGNMQAEQEEFSPGEMGLARLMREVEAETPAVAPKPVQKIRYWQAAAAALLVVVLGQAGLQFGAGKSDMNGAGFTLAGAGDPAAPVTVGPQITVGFTPGTELGDLSVLLSDAGVTLAGGPTADGLYIVTPKDGVALDDASAVLVASDLVDMLELP